MNSLRKARAQSEDGFTLIELMIVVVIIGILAAVAIPIFMNQQKEAVFASVKSDVRATNTALATYFTKNPTANGFYFYKSGEKAATGSLASEPAFSNLTLSNRNVVKIRLASGGSNYPSPELGDPGNWNDYTVIGWNEEMGLNSYRFTFSSDTGKYKETRA
jgi:type IV pilus assembly protein PilA